MVKKRNEIRAVISYIVSGLKSKGIKVNKLILFGSYAKGNPRPDSDMDFAVISSSFDNKNILKRQELLGEAIFGIGEPIEAIGYSRKEFEKRSKLSFLFDIVKNGKTVYSE